MAERVVSVAVVALVITLAASSSAFVSESQSNLAVQLLDKLDRPGNTLVSPSSIFYGLAMLYSGMDGNTKETVGQALGFPTNDDQEFKNAMEMFTTKKEGSPLFLGNFISFRKGLVKGKSAFARDVGKVFHADIYQQDFSDPEKQRRNINKWVWRRTNKKIRELMPAGSISSDTVLVLVNALYFKSEFETPFADESVSGTFKTSSGEEVETEMMTSGSTTPMSVKLGDVAGSTVVAIPFKESGYYLVLALPQEGFSTKQMLSNSEELMSMVTHPDQMEDSLVELQMPMFNVTMGNELTGLLSSIPGLSSAFGPNADYSKITDKPVKIQQVNHKATFEINKNGVEASAATSISVIAYSLFTADQTIIFDRPFAYFIVEDGKAIHMAGILNNPKEM